MAVRRPIPRLRTIDFLKMSYQEAMRTLQCLESSARCLPVRNSLEYQNWLRRRLKRLAKISALVRCGHSVG